MANKEMNPKLTIEQRDEILTEAMKVTEIKSMPGFYMPFSLESLRAILNANTEESKPVVRRIEQIDTNTGEHIITDYPKGK